MTPLGLLNFLVLQWFGVRLARCTNDVEVDDWFASCRRVGERVRIGKSDGSVYGARVIAKAPGTVTLQWWRLLRWIVPLTGWWSDYRWIARRS